MKKENAERSGVVRCQRCLKYGHYTYECQNEAAYRYRPSRTVMYKQKIKLQLNKDKGPKSHIIDRDFKRIYVEDKPSSDEQDLQGRSPKIVQQADVKLQKNEEKPVQQVQQLPSKVVNKEDKGKAADQVSNSSSSQSSSSSSSSSSSQQQKKPTKKRKL